MDNEDKSGAVAKALHNEYILQELFKFLSLNDRRNARLVCKTWFLLCPNNAFYFFCFDDIPSIDRILTENAREKLNLNFVQYNIEQDFFFILDKYGNKIDSLEFHQCYLHCQLVEKIVTHCINLKKISFHWIHIDETAGNFFSYLDENRDHLRIESLKTFIWNCPDYPLAENFLRWISVYSKLIKFHVTYDSDAVHSCLLLHTIIDKLPYCKDIQISITYAPGRPFTVDHQTLLHWTSEFTKNLNEKEEKNLLKRACFFSKSLSLHLMSDVTKRVLSVLVKNVNLEDFTFTWYARDVEDFIAIFTALVNSRLKSLHIVFVYLWDYAIIRNMMDTISLSTGTLSYNFTVSKLYLEVGGCRLLRKNSKFPDLFLKYFPRIQELIFEEDDRLNREDRESTFSFFLQEESMLIPLKTYHIFSEPIKDVQLLQMTESIWKYKFSNLIYLCLENRRKYIGNVDCDSAKFAKRVIDTISLLPKEYPKLEAVEFLWLPYVFEKRALVLSLESCLNLRHLRYISFCVKAIVSDSSFVDHTSANHMDADQIDKYFSDVMVQYANQRPLIRCIWLETRNNINALYIDKDTRRYQFYRKSKELPYLKYCYTPRLKNLWTLDY